MPTFFWPSYWTGSYWAPSDDIELAPPISDPADINKGLEGLRDLPDVSSHLEGG